MPKWKKLLGLFTTALICFFGAQVVMMMIFRPHQREFLSADYWSQWRLLGEVMRIVHRDYVVPEKAGYQALAKSALSEMLDGLDRYSEFMDLDDFQEFERQTEQHYVGIGIEIERLDSRVTLMHVFDGGPALEVGLLVGDQIVQVGDKDTRDASVSEMVDLLTGPPGTKVSVTVLRPSESKTHQFLMERRLIDRPYVRDVEMVDESARIGYVRMSQFGHRSESEFAQALDELEDQGMRALIFDLRDNPGGILQVAVDVVGHFVGKDAVVVTTEGRDGRVRSQEISRVSQRSAEYPMVVLVNDRSASASEIVSGALQDFGKAIVLGERTVGKGSVQSIYGLTSGDGIRMTTAMYFLPSGRTIHEVGVTPDITVPSSHDETMRLYAQRAHLRSLGPERFALRFGFEPFEDSQLEAAKELLKGVLAF